MRLTLVALALASALGGWSCQRGDVAAAHRPRDAAEAVRQVRVGQMTASDIEQRFGPADERAPDGALVYRFAETRTRGTHTRSEVETVTFRFAAGTLTRVCRTRP